MKKRYLVGSLLVSIVVVVAAYLTNMGQEMAVRIGNLSSEDLHRIPSLAVLDDARRATATTDVKETMSAVHMLLNAQLGLIAITGLGCGVLMILLGRRQTMPPEPADAGAQVFANASPACTTLHPPDAVHQRIHFKE